MPDLKSTLIGVVPQLMSALVGGAVAGYFALLGVKRAISADREIQRVAEEKEIQGVLTALYHEIETLWERCMDTAGRQLESLNQGEMLNMFYPVFQDYFTFFHANAAIIGRIPNSSLRKSIVATYTKGKGLNDSYKMNNAMLEDFNKLAAQGDYIAADGVHLRILQEQGQILVQYASAIREAHDDVKDNVAALLKSLRTYITE